MTGSSPPATGWLLRLAGYARPRRPVLAATAGAAVGSALIGAGVPLIIRHVLDTVLAGHNRHIWGWVTVLAAAAVLQYALTYALGMASARLGFGIQFDLRRDVFAALVGGAGPELGTGQIVSRSITDLAVIGGVIRFVPQVISALLLFVVALVVMAVLSPLLTLVVLAVVPAVWLVSRRSRRVLFPANWDAQQRAGELVGQVEAAVTGVRVVKGFGQEDRELAELDQRARTLFASRLRAVRMQARYGPTLVAVPALGQVGVLLLGGALALHGHLTLGTFLAFSTYLAQLIGPVEALSELLIVGPQCRACVERIGDILDARPAVVDAPDAMDPPAGPFAVAFENVSFGYAETEVLSAVSLRIEPGETVAVVGASGSGKSTLAQLIGRFHDPDAGTVAVGGHDVRRLRLAALRGGIGYVFDESFLFSDTIAANIGYGRPDATRAEIEAAAVLAEADGFIRALPDGYDTVVGERGQTLSGGQRQRIAIARAVLVRPRLLILDDATSAVDPRVEARINARLRDAGRTTILIAHRRASLELADRVVLLVAGRVAAIGPVAELERTSPEFRRLFAPTEAETDAAEVSGNRTRRRAGISRAAAMAGGTVDARTFARDGGIAGSAAGTPQLRAQVARLEPATDEPHITDADARSGDADFGLRRLIRPVRGALLLGLALVGLDAVGQLILPAVVRGGIDRGVSTGDSGTLLALSGLAFGVVLAAWVVDRAGLLVTGRTGERLLFLLRVKTFAQLQRLGLDYYERQLGGRIMTRMTTDVDALSAFLQTGVSSMFIGLVTLVGVLVALVVLNAALSLVLVAMLPVVLVAAVVFRRLSVPTYRQMRDELGAVNAALQENVAGLRVVQAFCREAENTQRFTELSRSYRQTRLRSQRYIETFFPFVTLLSQLAGALVLGFGAARLDDGTLTAGALIAFFLYLEAFFAPVRQLSEVFDDYQQAAVGLNRLRELLRTPTSTPTAATAEPVTGLRGEITFADVSFGYGAGEVLSGLRLTIAAGETVALVGETGAGKSTVVKLVSRFYDPTAGTVLVDGHDLRGLDLGGYRRRLGLVPQEPYLSAGTIAEAIAYGRPAATAEQVEDAARAVGAHEAIQALPDGYRHQVGERGANLSAGQRQLIALARAELVQPDILLLDEATAALDLASEAVVARATRRLTRRRTTLVVAHRLSTAARADRIVVLAGGRIVETGTHEQLLAAGGDYAELWASYADRPIENVVPE